MCIYACRRTTTYVQLQVKKCAVIKLLSMFFFAWRYWLAHVLLALATVIEVFGNAIWWQLLWFGHLVYWIPLIRCTSMSHEVKYLLSTWQDNCFFFLPYGKSFYVFAMSLFWFCLLLNIAYIFYGLMLQVECFFDIWDGKYS